MAGKFGFGHPTVYRPGSVRFDSALQQYAEMTLTAIGTSTATIELWINADSSSTAQRIVSTSTIAFTTNDFAIHYDGTNFKAGPGIGGMTSSTLPSAGSWHHVAWVGVSGTSQSLYLDGSRVATGGAYSLTDTVFRLGGRNISADFYNGYISNFRYIIGTALYSGTTYTVPTKTLNVLPGTEVLLQTLYGPTVLQDSSTNNHALSLFGIGSEPSGSLLTPFS